MNLPNKNTNYRLTMMLILFLSSLMFSCDDDDIIDDFIENVEAGLVYEDQPCASCDFVILPDEWYFDGIENNVQPGDTIGIPGNLSTQDEDGVRNRLKLQNIIGTKEQPVVIINCDGRAQVGTHKIDEVRGMEVVSSEHFIIQGTGSTNDSYGLAFMGWQALDIAYFSTDFEVFGVEVLGAGFAGIVARSNATCDGEVSKETHTQYNTILHHNYVHDTDGEGFYVGGSHWDSGQDVQPGCVGTLIWEPELVGVRIYNNIVKNTGLDGIQVGSAIEDVEIYNNYIENYATHAEHGHRAGFQINSGTTGKLYNNVVNTGDGYGIFMLGQGGNYVFNNVIINPSLDGIISGDRNPNGEGYHYLNNTIINPGEYGFHPISQFTALNRFYNNIVITPGMGFFLGEADTKISHNILTNDPDTISFVNYKSVDFLDFILQSESPAIDIGMDVSSEGVTFDLNGNERNDGFHDVGAFEYVK